MMKFCRSVGPGRVAAALILVTSFPAAAKSPLPENTPVPDLTRETVEDLSNTYHLGPTGARGWIHKHASYATPDDFEAFISTARARQILVTSVDPGSPADGKLEPGDVILGAGEGEFDRDVRKAFAAAIDEAERPDNRGRLRLLRWRPDPDGNGSREWIVLQLEVAGEYGATAPARCSKTDWIIQQTVARILDNGIGGRLHIEALGLLATGQEELIAEVGDYIERKNLAPPDLELTVEVARSMSAWHWGYAAVLLAEYHLLTGDSKVLPALESYAVTLAKGQANSGTWGHKMADLEFNDGRPNGRLTGYGALNQSGVVCLLAMQMAKRCGIEHPELDRAIEGASQFYGYYAGKGAIPYGYGRPLEYMLTNNGMSGSAAIAFAAGGDLEKAAYFIRLSAAAHAKTEVGHTGPYFGIMWTPLGANLGGPKVAAAFFAEHRWLHTLARRWDGGFVYQPPGGRWGGSKEVYQGLSSDGAHLLVHAAARRALLITGRDAAEELRLDGTAAVEAVEAGQIDYEAAPVDELLDLLGHGVPAVRRHAADELGRRDAEIQPRLMKMLEQGSDEERIGACHALAALGPRASDAADALLKVIADPDQDSWLRSRALGSLPAIDPPLESTAGTLLAIVANHESTDLRRDLERDMAVVLARMLDRPYEMDLDFDLFHRAANSLLDHPHHIARTAAIRLVTEVPPEHFHAVGPAIREVILNRDAGYLTYHHDAPRAGGLAIFERLDIREGIDLAMATLELDMWGQKWRISGSKGRLALLARYGSAARDVLPELQQLREQNRIRGDDVEYLEAIEAAAEERELISFDEAMARGRDSSG